ncbi:MAG: histidine phosphatase family protein [Clostridia bacterium]|nr:histidine phosphatase family protein [Clostridia bacterium]
MSLFVTRHGQTPWNVENKVCGLTDIPLTEIGIEQARALAQSAKDKNFSAILSSPLLRARHTAQFTADACHLPVVIEPRLIEQNYGIYEGKSGFDLGFLENKRLFATRYPKGESHMDVAARVYPLLEELREKCTTQNVLLVCHGGVCRVIHTFFHPLTNDEYFHYQAPNATLIEYHF